MVLLTGEITRIRGSWDEEPGQEYLDAVADILPTEAFRRLRGFRHHTTTIYNHVRSVSYVAYKIARRHDLNWHAAARGGLLHDFFHYDWRTGLNGDGRVLRAHMFVHPRIALTNAMRHYAVNDIERDIILRHMWPLTPALPRYRESYVVNFADKYVASREFLRLSPYSRERRSVVPVH